MKKMMVGLQHKLDNIVGVTINWDAEVENVKLQFSERRFPYVLTKPLHGSQTIIDEEERIVQINVIPNKELESLILQFGDDVEILSPQSLRNQIKEKIQEMIKKY